jgi:hypothetical protein
VTQQYLIGELSARLERLQGAAMEAATGEVETLRHQVETRHVTGLAAAMNIALALADRLCWDSLSRGDVVGFARQAEICEDLRLFGVCARLLDDD